MTHHPTTAEWLMLSSLFRRAADDGYGFFDGTRFEAMPGMEDAAADRIQELFDDMGP